MKKRRNNIVFWIIVMLAVLGIGDFVSNRNTQDSTKAISYTKLQNQIRHRKIKSMTITPKGQIDEIKGTYKKPLKNRVKDMPQYHVKRFQTTILQSDPTIAQLNSNIKYAHIKANIQQSRDNSMLMNMFVEFAPMLLFILFIYWMYRRSRSRGQLKGLISTKIKQSKKSKVRFSDVAGEDEAKQELAEVVNFLKHPERYTKLGARIPHGVLLEGPPGTGKTLLAKAVAGEAGVPFYAVSGSDFVKMFVGAGASRVRKLFRTVKKHAPAIIFIDEIDAIGKRRGSNGFNGGDDEREQTLNQLLVAMDGFNSKDNVVVLGATNRADTLDPALVRPGRFDRKVQVGRPDVRGRYDILKIHARNKPFSQSCNLKEVARQTPGFVGADLANLLNEAALLAARENKSEIDNDDLSEAEDRVIAGPARKHAIISKHDERIVANHEAGHTIVGLVLKHARDVHKVTIIPRGHTGGFTLMLPKEGQVLLSKQNGLEQIAGMMGGRVAEQVNFNNLISSGASSDFAQATKLARAMVTQYGMSSKLGDIALESPVQNPYAKSAYSEHTNMLIDQEVSHFLRKGYNMAHKIVLTHHKQQKLIAKALLKYETLDAVEIKSLYETGHMPTNTPVIYYPDGTWKYWQSEYEE